MVVSALRRHGSWLSALMLAPLLLSYGLHTFVWRAPDGVAGILSTPIPIGPPAAGLRAALGDIYWAAAGPLETQITALPDLWAPAFPLGYSLTFVVVAQAARSDRPTWLGSMALAGLVGFLGLLVTTLAPVVGLLWAGLEALRLDRARRSGTEMLKLGYQCVAGLAVAGLLLLFGGGALSGVVGGRGDSGLAWSDGLDSSHWQVLGDVSERSGGVGLLSVGSLGVAAAAAMLARGDRRVLALSAGAGLLAFVLAGARLSTASPGSWTAGGACAQPGADCPAAGAERPTRRPAAPALALCRGRAPGGPGGVADGGSARTQFGQFHGSGRATGQRRRGVAGGAGAGCACRAAPASDIGNVQPPGRHYPRPD